MKIVEKIREEIEKRKNDYMAQATSFEGLGVTERTAYYSTLASNMASLILYIDSLSDTEKDFGIKSNDLEEAANSCSSCIYLEEVLSDDDKEVLKERLVNTFKAGAQWQQQKTDKDMIEALRTEYEKGRHDVIEKTLKWLWDLNQQHEIMSYTDSHVLSSEELQKYYKNNIE